MNDADFHRANALAKMIFRTLAAAKGHETGCKCPEKKLMSSVLSAVSRLEKLETRLVKFEKTKQARINLGVNPPCKKS